ncbi:SPOR domain-containing protein [Sphingopyxis sp. PET50]|uniref:SPOR domain-containing protein n=1 Tax=Sphingopyxis sp. PET50 TaxID=2976533 RepID=UPI0028A71AFB|nr:SPOR domain-containing protein [Sphingopyxis sp. PET50]
MRIYRTALLLSLPLLAAAPAIAAPAAGKAAAAAAPTVKDGVDLWEAGNPQQAVSIWRPLALAGDPDAQFNLGQAYKLGRGVPADLAQAETWYRRAAKQGHLQAEDNLGLVLFTANRRNEAMPFITRSAARGEPRAQYVLGTAMFNGDLAAQDWPRAYALTKRASDAGLGIASARLAQLDSLIPLEQRQAGLALIPEMEKSEQRERLAAVNAAAPPPPAPAPSPVKTASLPASVPGTSYTPPPVIQSPPASPRAADAAAAATEASKDAAVAIVSQPLRPAPQPVKPVEIAAAAPAPGEPGTSYAAPPEKGDLSPAAPPKPALAPVKAAPPQPQSAPPAAAAAPTAADNWRAQLGAFAQEGNARNLWLALERKYPGLANRQPYLVKSGKLTRLQAGNFASKADADKFCATVGSASQPCVVMSSR